MLPITLKRGGLVARPHAWNPWSGPRSARTCAAPQGGVSSSFWWRRRAWPHDLVSSVPSSEIIRRMEASISSIDGSCSGAASLISMPLVKTTFALTRH